MGKGLEYCYWKTNDGKLEKVTKGSTFRLYTSDKNEFIVNERCVAPDTKNVKFTVDNARWAFIYNEFFESIKSKPDKSNNLWGNLSGGKESVARLGLGKNYSIGSRLSFSPSESNSYYLGFKQRIELFSTEPGSGFYFYFVPLTKSHIKYAYFNDSEAIKRYGDIVNLQISLHGYNLEKDIKYKAKLYLLEEEKAVGLTETKQFRSANIWKKPEIINIPDKFSGDNWNVYLNYSFPIEIEWRKNQSEKKNFTVIVEIYKTWIDDGYIYDSEEEERVDYRNFADKPTNDLVNYDANVLGLQDLDDKPSISSRFIVSEELMDDYLSRIELQKTNMIQYIGDIRYTKREFDPCGYSKITLKDEDDKERDSMVIFNEEDTENPIDQTAKVFTIITGDARKNISITLDKLKNKKEFCQGVLLELGQKHSEQKNVFQLDRVMPALREENGVYVVVQDTTQKDDYDAVLDKKRGASGSVSDAQEWKVGVDYKIDSDDKMTVMPRYLYNKTGLEGIQNYTSHGIPNEALNTLWVFNYFILSDKLAQTYFVPISTCRYPNQIAKIHVYPDIEWELAALIAVPLWKKTTFKFQSSRTTREGFRDLHRNFGFRHIRRELSVEAETESAVGADFTLKASTSGKDYEAGFKIEKSIKKAINVFNAVYEQTEVFDGTAEDITISAAYKKGVLSAFEFNLDPPNVALALKWKHEVAKDEVRLGWRMEGVIALKPFVAFGITVDLVQIVGKFGWVGKAVEFIIWALEQTIKDLDIYFNFKLNAEIAGDLSFGYHSIDGWDKNAKRSSTFTVNATIEAGVKYENVTLIAEIVSIGTDEKIEGVDIQASLGAGVEYKEEWDCDEKGAFKNVTVTFTGCTASFHIYAVITKRKKRVVQGVETEQSYNKQIGKKYSETLLEKKVWHGPERIYTKDEK